MTGALIPNEAFIAPDTEVGACCTIMAQWDNGELTIKIATWPLPVLEGEALEVVGQHDNVVELGSTAAVTDDEGADLSITLSHGYAVSLYRWLHKQLRERS